MFILEYTLHDDTSGVAAPHVCAVCRDLNCLWALSANNPEANSQEALAPFLADGSIKKCPNPQVRTINTVRCAHSCANVTLFVGCVVFNVFGEKWRLQLCQMSYLRDRAMLAIRSTSRSWTRHVWRGSWMPLLDTARINDALIQAITHELFERKHRSE